MNQITATVTNVTQASQTSKSVTLSDPKNQTTKPVFLDTLAQLTTEKPGRLLKRARSKYITASISIGLADLKSSLQKYYWNGYHCNEILLQNGRTVTGRYCNTRHCIVCNRIRTAKLINGYKKALQELAEPVHMVLTAKAVTAELLSEAITDRCNTIRTIFKKYTVRKVRECNTVTLIGVRKIEVTYNSTADTYHAHFHFIMNGEGARVLRKEWLSHYTAANPRAQHIVPVTDGALLELFKYATKIVTGKDGKKAIPFPALDIILQALYKRRTIQSFGGIRQVSEDIEDLHSEDYPELPEYELMEWVWHEHDWVNHDSECLTGFIPESDS